MQARRYQQAASKFCSSSVFFLRELLVQLNGRLSGHDGTTGLPLHLEKHLLILLLAARILDGQTLLGGSHQTLVGDQQRCHILLFFLVLFTIISLTTKVKSDTIEFYFIIFDRLDQLLQLCLLHLHLLFAIGNQEHSLLIFLLSRELNQRVDADHDRLDKITTGSIFVFETLLLGSWLDVLNVPEKVEVDWP